MQGEELRAIRKALGWTGERMAQEMGLSSTFIYLMERDEKPIEKRTELAARYLALTGGGDDPAIVSVPRMKLGRQAE